MEFTKKEYEMIDCLKKYVEEFLGKFLKKKYPEEFLENFRRTSVDIAGRISEDLDILEELLIESLEVVPKSRSLFCSFVRFGSASDFF